ncbi:helix-turn-helix transcriptional regulator [Burkholderia sp. Ac-20349]|uniref:ArsR/SmtB family transcription factor n=1 Tax=Burkholderia sp. Ac-20349 TaxID=2703893 RepID=UPI00197C6B9D|nr:helix-turn-helix transcriptional regulator [Burkholderia sp. Ac-20349]MBN3839299.1 helix-turn-helix transcriptional regulator [Burkholderia sp. Ac-20349]
MHPNRTVILALLERHGALTNLELQTHSGLKERTVRDHLHGLRDAKLSYVSDWNPPDGPGRHTPVWSAGDKKSKPMPRLNRVASCARYRDKMRTIINAKARVTPLNPYLQLMQQ